MQPTLIHVAWSNGRWRVTETGPRNAVTCFGERRDAMDYAAELAQRSGGSMRVSMRGSCSRRDARAPRWSGSSAAGR